MAKLIHISIRRNLYYIINLLIHYYLRKVDLIIINTKFQFNDSLIFTFLMFFGEFFAGLSIFLYQHIFLKKDIKTVKHFKIPFSIYKPKMNRTDNIFKIGLLIFFSASFDFVEFVIATFYIPRFEIVSSTAEYRFGGLIIIIGALICHFNLRIKILKHQFYSLIIIGICLAIIIILEIIYRGKGVSFGDFCFAHMLVVGYLIFVPFTDVIEKYLIEFNFINPFLILMIESIFGFIFISIYSAGENLFKNFNEIYSNYSTGEFVLFIFLLFLYFVFSAGTNAYKILTNGLYSPMAKTLAVYVLNPLIFLYYFIIGNDFLSDGERDWFYFIANIIISLIISFLGFVFNEFIILSCCGLEYETHSFISKRAGDDENINDIKMLNDLDLDPDSEF